MDERETALDFILRYDMFGSERVRCRWGTAVFLPALPVRHDSNYLCFDALPEDVTAHDVAAEADALQGAAGLGHRSVLFRHEHDGDRIAPGLAALGWSTHRGVIMRLREPPADVRVDPRVAEVPLDAIAAARQAHTLTYPWATAEVARQLAAARGLAPLPTRHFAIFADRTPLAWLDLFLEPDASIAQLEELATVERARRRGHARTLMLHAIARAREAARRSCSCAQMPATGRGTSTSDSASR